MVLPALAGPPPMARRWSSRSWRANIMSDMRYAPYSAAWNFAGFPALALPMGLRRDGLPASVQLVGPPESELRMLAVAAQMEQAAPWRAHAPTWPRVGVGSAEVEPGVSADMADRAG
jgi:amidase